MRPSRRLRAFAVLAVASVSLGCSDSQPTGVKSQPSWATPTTNVSGQVVDLTTGKPIAGAIVKADGVSTQSDSEGSYSVANVSVGMLTFETSVAGYHTQLATHTCPPRTCTFRIQLLPLPPD